MFEVYGDAAAAKPIPRGRSHHGLKGLMNSRQKRRPAAEDRRQRLIEGAVEVLLSEGVNGTTTRVLAARLGVNLATLHYYFQDKNDILLDIYKRIGDEHRGFLKEKLSQPSPLKSRIADLLNVIWEAVEKQRDQELLVYEMAIYGMRNKAFEASTRLMQDEWLSHYREILAQAVDIDPARSEIDVDGIANLCFTGFTGIILQWLITGDLDRARRSVNLLIEAAQTFAPLNAVEL